MTRPRTEVVRWALLPRTPHPGHSSGSSRCSASRFVAARATPSEPDPVRPLPFSEKQTGFCAGPVGQAELAQGSFANELHGLRG